MLKQTLSRLRCPKLRAHKSCLGVLELAGKSSAESKAAAGAETGAATDDITFGTLTCKVCKAHFPVLAGVAILVHDVRSYLLSHAKGIASWVKDSEIPREFQKEFRLARNDQDSDGSLETDLESGRVISLYLMNHYLNASQVTPTLDPVITNLVKQYWDHGPLSEVLPWVASDADVIELGCSVGGLARALSAKSYLGFDNSFQSVAWARHLILGATGGSKKIKIPGDLLNGPQSHEVPIQVGQKSAHLKFADYVVADFDQPPFERESFDCAIALNTIDMLDKPALQTELQKSLLKKGGRAIQSSPYIWPESVARKLKGLTQSNQSAEATQRLYEKAGFQILRSKDQIPWIFFKHIRQVEVYSVHLFEAQK